MTGNDYRKQIRHGHHRQRYLWGIFLAVVLLLLSVFSAGFFLYSALVVFGLLLAALAVAHTGLVGVEVNRGLSAHEIFLGQAVDAVLTVNNTKEIPAPWLFWQDHADKHLDVEGSACFYKTLFSRQIHRATYRLHSTRRGLFRVGPTVLESAGPFGLVRRFLVSQTVDFITVLPHIVTIGKGMPQGQRPIHQVPRRRSIFEDPSRFIGMRDYRPGDSMRRIHWRSTARTGQIQVKLFEPAVLAGALLALDMGLEAYPQSRKLPQEIDPLLEFTITAAASLGEYILSGDQTVGLISNGTDAAGLFSEDWQGGSFKRLTQALEQAEDLPLETAAYQPVEVEPAKGHWQKQRLFTALARLLPHGSMNLAELLSIELPRLPRSLVLVVITPLLDQAMGSVLRSLKRSGIETVVIWIQMESTSTGGTATGTAKDMDSVEAGYGRAFGAEALPQGIPIYRVGSEADIEALGAVSL